MNVKQHLTPLAATLYLCNVVYFYVKMQYRTLYPVIIEWNAKCINI